MDLVYFDLDDWEIENKKISYLGYPTSISGLCELILRCQERGFAEVAFKEAEKIFKGRK